MLTRAHLHAFAMLLLSLLQVEARADYQNISFVAAVTITNGTTFRIYGEVASVYFNPDSASTTYLLRTLHQDPNGYTGDTFRAFTLRFTYRPDRDSPPFNLYFRPLNVPGDSIRSIVLLDRTESDYSHGVASLHQPNDTLWMKGDPIQNHTFSGDLCSETVFTHRASAELEKEIATLANLHRAKERISSQIENESTAVSSSKKLASELARINEELEEIIKNLGALHAVVVRSCSC